jgi:hypothetical protein
MMNFNEIKNSDYTKPYILVSTEHPIQTWMCPYCGATIICDFISDATAVAGGSYNYNFDHSCRIINKIENAINKLENIREQLRIAKEELKALENHPAVFDFDHSTKCVYKLVMHKGELYADNTTEI